MIHFHDREVIADGKSFPHSGSPQDRRRAIAEAEAHLALKADALEKRSLLERQRPLSDKERRDGRYEPVETRGPAEIQCQQLLDQGATYNVFQARADAIRATRTNSAELTRLDELAASWTPPVVAPGVSESAFDVAIAAVQRKPGFTQAERDSTDRQIAALRAAGDKAKQDQAREAELQARFETDDFKNSVLNGESVAKLALLPNVPQSFVERANARLAKLKETGDTATYWRDTRAAEAELNAHFDSIEKHYDDKKVVLLSDKKAALSMLPVSPPVVVEPPKSIIEQALMPPEAPAP